MNKTLAVGHVIRQYLRLTETFVGSYLTHAQAHQPHVFTDILVSEFAKNIPCMYLIDQKQVVALGRQNRDLFFSQLDYPNCYVQAIADREVCVLHAHFGLMGYRALKLKRDTRLPLMVSFYGIDASHMLGLRQWQEAFAQVFERADVVTALGTDMADRLCLAGCPERKIQIVHLGVDLAAIPFIPRMPPETGEPLVLFYCGRLVEKKGIFDALEAFASVVDKWPQLVFRIVGDGALRALLNRKIRAMKLQGRVQVLGALPHRRVLEEMANAHVFILPSKTASNGDMEGTPTVLLEAQASGLPVLSTFHADIPEVVLDGQSGFLVPEGDVVSLADKLNLLLSMADVWADFGREGRAHIKKYYHILTEVKKLETLYQKLV